MCGGACEENWFDNLVESVGDGCRTSFWRDNYLNILMSLPIQNKKKTT